MKARLTLLALLCCSSAFAADPQLVNNASIDNAGRGYNGVASVNQAAGDEQQQANGRAIAIGTSGGASTRFHQSVITTADPSQAAKASITGNSFSNGSGALGVNQAAGTANQQVNAMSISVTAVPQSVDDNVLSQQNITLSQNSGPAGSTMGSRQVVTSDQAFAGSRGVVQVSQSAGIGNRIANTLSIRVAD
ncbi:adhesin [Pseudomonas citronellolis]|uniref:adhesin n=1 Tax=Pseudomonas citronellolis TaxID=53408 RepID=UPI0022BA2603|nr:adhesin [Pseudomonas citronellolis]WBG61961.1 adhesin [Pseudomonas citronellolis]